MGLHGCAVELVEVEVEVVEARGGMAAGEVHGRLALVLDDERVAVERDERGREHRSHELPDGGAQRAVAAGECVAELAGDALRAERLGAGDAGLVEHKRGAQPGGELGDASERVGVGKRAFELGVDDRAELARFVAAGVADGLLALRVGPAGAVGDQLAVVADE